MPKKYFKSDHFGGGGSLSESHLRSIPKVWVTHYNGARPHMALGLGVPDRPAGAVRRVDKKSRHHLGARSVLSPARCWAACRETYDGDHVVSNFLRIASRAISKQSGILSRGE
jgi:hypothetical protein